MSVYPTGVEVQRGAQISADERFRFTLHRRWEYDDHILEGRGPGQHLTFVMLNPSTADALDDDATVRKCVGFARRLGFGAINIVNLYAFRTRYPDDLKAAGYPTGGERNDDLLRELGRHMEHGKPVIAAWGMHAPRSRVAEVLGWRGWDQVTALGVTKDGAPRHPSRLSYGPTPQKWSLP